MFTTNNEINTHDKPEALEYLAGEIIDDRYLLEKVLWSSDLLVLYNTRDLQDDSDNIIRIYSQRADLSSIRYEINISMELSHPTIPSFKDWRLDKKADDSLKNYVVTEPVNYKSIFGSIQYSEKMLKYLFSQMLDSIAELHRVSYYGLDLNQYSFVFNKPSIKNEDSYCIKFIDLEKGRSREKSPEREKRRRKFSDIYGLGELLFMMATGSRPFQKKSLDDRLYYLITTDSEKFVQEHPNLQQALHGENRISSALLELMLKLLSMTEDNFLSINDIREEIWMLKTDFPFPEFVKTVLENLW